MPGQGRAAALQLKKPEVIVIPREEVERLRRERQQRRMRDDNEIRSIRYELEDLRRQSRLLETAQYARELSELRQYVSEIKKEKQGTLLKSVVGTLASAFLPSPPPSQIHDRCEREIDCVVKGYVMYRSYNGRFVSSRNGVYVRR